MVEISILDHKHNNMPDIVARADTEREVVDIFVILYNAYMLTNSCTFQLTNVGKDYTCTTYLVGINTFDELQNYMNEVHHINLIMF